MENNKNEHNHRNGEYCKECYDKYLQEKGVSNDGYNINPEYVKDEDQIIHLKYFRMIQDDISLVVPKEYYEDGFSLEDYVNNFLSEDPFWEDHIRESKIHFEVDNTHPIGECDYPHFVHYVSEDGLFWNHPHEETKSFDDEVVETSKLLN